MKITSDTFGGLQARSIGPAVMGGRIAALDAIPSSAGAPLTIYVGAASGGVWKSVNGGVTFKPVFDEHTQSIGAVTIDPSDSSTVWVGTGESWVRNSVSVGTGVYRTSDGGETWQRMGLEGSERIARIVVSPKDGKTVLVCATGHLWDAHEERGVYRTADGGTTWERTLFVDADTGCSDLAMDPQDPRVLYAGMWQFRRRPDFFTSGGPGSGLYKSTDGGTTWKELTQGLPEGDKGRIAVAVAPSRPSVVYAVVEAKKTAFYRSDDLGATWQETNASFNVQVRPFYFALVVVDPHDPNTVYKPGLTFALSTDGGRSFTSPFSAGAGRVHSDLHALWINPRDTRELLLGTDGGLYHSQDQGRNWRYVNNLPISQFYHVSYDMQTPYWVYGGLQDNGSWTGPSASIGGIEARDWSNVGFGDGFWTFADPNDSDTIYSEYQGGRLLRVTRSTSEVKDIQPYARGGEKSLRFNWNTPIHLSPNDPGTLYVGSQYLLRSRDRGETWEQVSEDLTTNDPERQKQAQSGGLSIDNSTAENNTTIHAVSESPGHRDVLWVGTDDGNLQVSRDGGRSWTNVAANVPGVPPGTWVSSVQASRHAPARAYVTFDGHRTGDMRPHVFRTDDFGATWSSLATEVLEGFAHVIREDLEHPDLLFLGTEHGLFVTLDGGAQWARFSGGFPKVAVHDIAIHPREHDVILATHGRGVYIIDDITPLRALTPSILEKDVALLPSRPSIMPIQGTLQEFTGDEQFVGRNPSEAAQITYWLRKRHLFGDLKVEVYDEQGRLISTVPGTKRVGINRIEWPMRLKAPQLPPSTSLVPAFTGPRVPEGTYTLRLIKGKETLDGKVRLVADPRSTHSPEQRRTQQVAAMKLYQELERLTYVAESVAAARAQAAASAEGLRKNDPLRARLIKLSSDLEGFGKELAASSEAGFVSGEEKLREKMGNLYGSINQYEGSPTGSQLQRLEDLLAELDSASARFDAIVAKEVAAVNAQLQKQKLPAIGVLPRDEWLRRKESGEAAAGVSGLALSPKAAGALLRMTGGLPVPAARY
ncbi:MAG TPA: glycosyl hydrolase [Candidatus Polarisedimenticolia bacterium]|nr:glycosyl hydrolase [Candidatus Polarisedimenticolia bacterium]